MGNKIHNEIADIAPTLASLEKKNPFRVPEGYFDALEHKILDALDKKPVLEKTIPEGYFDNLTDIVLDRIKEEEKPKVMPLYQRKWLSIAASLLIILGAGYLITIQSGTATSGAEFALEIDLEEALDYLEENDNLYLSDLIGLDLDEEDFSIGDSELSEFEDEEFEDFLEELDPEDLEDLL
ncbi:MAG: hypothetical protein AAGA77_02290 [Bacteroidota bacterium]